MKYISHILTILAGIFLFVACQKDDIAFDEEGKVMNEIPVRFNTNLPTSPGTRGMVKGEKYPPVTSIQMLCFDSYGMYVARRMATPVSSTSSSPDHGTFEGNVPEVTARIHFIANHEVVLNTRYIGMEENVLMQSEETSTLYSSNSGLVFWGYHRESTPDAMKSWLVGNNTVYFLADRAIVELGNVHDDKVEAVQGWIISNGRERGYIAPFDQSHSNTDPFSGYYDASDNTLHNPFTEYSTAGRYTALESEMEPTTNPLFLYEDVNLRDEGAVNTVKVILKVKYRDTTIGNGGIRYQAVLLQDSENQQFTVTRGHRYIMNLGKLPFELGFTTFEAAVAATSFSNNQTVSVVEEVSVLTNGEVEMDINNGKTSIIYQSAVNDQGQVKLIPFSFEDLQNGGAPFKLNNEGNPTTQRVDASNFTLNILNNTGALTSSSSDIYINDYDQTTGKGHIAVKVGTISTSLQSAKISITDKTYGMSRNINFYTIDEFRLIGDMTLTNTGVTRNVLGKTCTTYKLSFTMPANYPSGLYPIEIEFATSTLNAYSDTQAGTAHGSFGVSVESTADLNSSNNNRQWNYNAANWGYWYTYSILTKPEEDGNIHLDIFFDDVRQFRATQANNVGLFLKIKYFGDVKTVTL